MGTRPLIRESLLLLNIDGLNPLTETVRAKTIAAFTLMLYSAFTAEVLMHLVFNWKGLDSSDVVAQFAVDFQIVTKIIVLIFHRKKLLKMLYKMENFFWPLDKYGPALQSDIQNSCSRIQKIFLYVFVSAAATLVVYSAIPLFSNARMLPFAFYHPKDLSRSPIYEIVYIVQLILVFFIAFPAMLGFDFLFVSLIIHVVNELKILKRGFSTIQIDENVPDNKSLESLIPLIDHHNLVLGCIKDLNEIFSLLLLIEFLASIFSICTGLLGVISDGLPPDFQHIMKPVPYLITFSNVLLLYCIVGTLLMTESESVADAVYKSKWWIKTQPNLRRGMVLAIQRALKTEKITAGGMVDLNLLTFTDVIRTAFSFTMLAQAVFMKTN